MARPDKAATVAEIADEFRSSNAAVLTEYRGLSVKQLQELRRALGENATYAVVKNTLTKLAAKEAGVDSFDELLTGPSAIAFVKGDAVEAAKSLRDFARANSPLVIKGGVLDGKPLTPAEIAKIADLESREVLLAKLAGAMLASLNNAVYLLNAPLAQAARLVGALQAKAEQDPSILAGGAGTPAASEEASAVADEAASETEAVPAAETESTDAASAEAATEAADEQDPVEEPAAQADAADEAPSEAATPDVADSAAEETAADSAAEETAADSAAEETAEG
jgi:large subunit ribosomal protein L10